MNLRSKQEESKRTQEFLVKVSQRLSGRSECAGKEYLLGIGVKLRFSDFQIPKSESTVSQYIDFLPNINTYRDNKHRKDKDLFRVTDWVLHRFFSDLILGRDEYGQLKVDTSKFINGVYKYQRSMDGKRRRWISYSFAESLKYVD